MESVLRMMACAGAFHEAFRIWTLGRFLNVAPRVVDNAEGKVVKGEAGEAGEEGPSAI